MPNNDRAPRGLIEVDGDIGSENGKRLPQGGVTLVSAKVHRTEQHIGRAIRRAPERTASRLVLFKNDITELLIGRDRHLSSPVTAEPAVVAVHADARRAARCGRTTFR